MRAGSRQLHKLVTAFMNVKSALAFRHVGVPQYKRFYLQVKSWEYGLAFIVFP